MNAPLPEHAVRAHAILSASSADRWLMCPPSARLNEKIADERSSFAAEGTLAHELAERALVSGRHAHEIEGAYPHDMRDHVQQYVDYVRAVPGELMIEKRLSFTKWVQEGFGTTDAIVISEGHMRIIDLKYGKGVRVDADDNAQLKLYALGAYDAYDPIWGPIDTVTLVIVQPRLDHISEWSLSTNALMIWAEDVVKPIAALAWDGKGEFKSGDHCQFCKSRHTCRARADEALKEVGDMDKGPELTNEELAAIYPKLKSIIKWANDLTDYCLGRAENGTRFPGLKLVEGRSDRAFTDDVKVAERFASLGFTESQYLTRKILGITAAEKLVGKKNFTEKFGDLITKPPGKATLVPVTDERPEISNHDQAVAELLSS